MPLARAGYVELVDGGNKSSCRSACRLTGKGREFAKWAFNFFGDGLRDALDPRLRK